MRRAIHTRKDVSVAIAGAGDMPRAEHGVTAIDYGRNYILGAAPAPVDRDLNAETTA